MTRLSVTRAAMRYRRKQDEALMLADDPATRGKAEKDYCRGRAFAYGEVARYFERKLKRMKK